MNRTDRPQKDIYATITDRIIAALERGTKP